MRRNIQLPCPPSAGTRMSTQFVEARALHDDHVDDVLRERECPVISTFERKTSLSSLHQVN
jgi:hypothetical protein